MKAIITVKRKPFLLIEMIPASSFSAGEPTLNAQVTVIIAFIYLPFLSDQFSTANTPSEFSSKKQLLRFALIYLLHPRSFLLKLTSKETCFFNHLFIKNFYNLRFKRISQRLKPTILPFRKKDFIINTFWDSHPFKFLISRS